jgi:hypothetical protein
MSMKHGAFPIQRSSVALNLHIDIYMANDFEQNVL